MVGRKNADGRLRIFGWFFAYVVLALGHVAADPVAALGSPDQSLGVMLSSEDEKILVLRGSSIDSKPEGSYSVTVTLLKIPCPGTYSFQAEGEDQNSGSVNSYTATLVLSDLSAKPRGAPCGRTVPDQRGHGKLVVSGESSEPLRLVGGRGGTGSFTGSLLLRGLPECEKPYTLFSSFDLRGWRRSFTFRLEVTDVTVTVEGERVPGAGC
jgi:hypothetical protein